MALRPGEIPIYNRDVSAPKHLVVISHAGDIFGTVLMPQSGSGWNLVVPVQDDRIQYENLTTRPVTHPGLVQIDAAKPITNSICFVPTSLALTLAAIGG